MEQFFPSFPFPILVSFLIFIFMVVKIGRRKRLKSNSKTPLPGPWKLPIIGNIHQLVGSSPPHHTLTNLAKKHGPLMHLQLGEVSFTIISSADMAKEVMKTHDTNFASRAQVPLSTIVFYGSTDIFFAPYGNYWRQLRKICTTELLTMKRVQSFKRLREEVMSDLLKSITSSVGMSINLSKIVCALTYESTARSAFGRKCKDQDLFISTVEKIIKVAAGFDLADFFPSLTLFSVISGLRPNLEKLHKITDQILESIINEHKARVQSTSTSKGEVQEEDLVDVLIKIQKDGDLEFPLSTNNIKAVILDIFIAGSETSSTTVDWAMAEMMKNPRVMEKAQAEIRRVFDKKGGEIDETDFHVLEYLKLVIKETLRLHPPAPLLLPRECKETCEINGYEIGIETKVIINTWAIARDPNYWTEPDKFFPERFMDCPIDYKGAFEFMPFGAGRRICPGIVYGMMSVEVQLVHLLYHFDWKLPNEMKNEDLDMTEHFAAAVSRKDDLCLVPVSYNYKNPR